VSGEGRGSKTKTVEPPIEYVPLPRLGMHFDKAWLADESDVDRYLAALKSAIMQEIQQQKRVQI
jgi:hypothetical protein